MSVHTSQWGSEADSKKTEGKPGFYHKDGEHWKGYDSCCTVKNEGSPFQSFIARYW